MAKPRKGGKDDFMKDWMKKSKPNPDKLSRHTIKNDKWDREDVSRLLEEMPDFDAYREKLADSKAGDLAYDVWQDLYLSLWKVDPDAVPDREIRPTHLVNKVVTEEAQKLPDHQELRNWTMGDDIGTALACNTIEPDVETLYDRLEEEVKMAQELQQMMQGLAGQEQEQRDLDELMKDWTDDPANEGKDEPTDWSEQQKNLQDAIDKAKEGCDKLSEELKDALNGKRPGIASDLKGAMQKANDEQETMNSMAESWGLEPGQLHRLPANERIDLAKRLNNPKFKRIAELFGPMKRLAFTEQRRKVNYAPEEIYDIELGDNLSRILPQELAKLGNPEQEMMFFKDFYERHVPQYKMRGYEKVAKGGIIYCHDGSGSMGGDREMWAKAVGLCLLHIAKKQKRPFVAIQFGSPHQIRIDDFRDTEGITPEQVIDFAEFFFGGGTDFQTPLIAAVDILKAEAEKNGGATKSDIVFATDGMCGITDQWFDQFKADQKKLNFRCWGINIGGNTTDEPMAKICDGLVASISSITNGENMREIFGGI